MYRPQFTTLALTLLAVTALTMPPAPHAQTGIVDHCLSTAIPVGFPTGIAVCPDGDGETLAGKGARIDLQLLDINGAPIPNIPWGDIWLIGCTNQLVLCGGSASSNADANSDANGETTITGTIAAGGTEDGVAVVVQGVVLSFPLNCSDIRCLALNVRSVDFDGSLTVDIVDLANFAIAFPPNPYISWADFDFDGAITLVDLSFFAQHFAHMCL